MTCDLPRSKHELYDTWRAMIRRCHNPAADNYPRYGGRGITVCQAWRDSFDQFLADLPSRPTAEYSLERIDNNRGYEPGNVRWATATEQARNRRDNHYLRANGQTRLLEEWADITGIPKSTLYNRIAAGWTDEAAVTTPVRPKAPDNSIAPAGIRSIAADRQLKPETVISRLRRGWDYDRAISQPPAPRAHRE
ncbi:hypothetical protein AB0N17_03255 [Streptomyces sp. NPDC051133]|uniref:hypothetical protein n=1 Tax=Streptomyces sp. NPDC051133 TaxID=3155521 RepID=UPI00344868E7